MSNPVCAIVGAGPGNGAAFARRFARDGYDLALLARDLPRTQALAGDLRGARAYACDAGDAASVDAAFAQLRGELGDPEVVIYNAGTGAFTDFDTTTAADFESSWRVNALGAFLVAKQVVPAMRQHGRGAIVFVGATASRRGGKKTAAFASAKAAQRLLAESLAKSVGPDGIHVALIVIDGVVDLPRTRAKLADKPDSFFVHPDDVAATAAFLVSQPRSAWSFEVEARPFGETW